jgi:DNA mismatch endonuclease, patch repair protein
MSEDPETRSRIMRAVKGKDTTPEMTVRRMIHAMGYRYRLYRKDLPGKPDLVFPQLQKIIFINGCFWHGHDCARGARIPKTNRKYWQEKIARNCRRDAESIATLQSLGWRVAIIWECELKDLEKVKKRVAKFLSQATK